MRRVRDGVGTRRAILKAAHAEMYKFGFQAASVAHILKHTQVTKGAFFHHFASKKALGYAVVEELIADIVRQQWVLPLSQSADPLQTILDAFLTFIEGLEQEPEQLGCPLNNLAQEMSPLDAGFQHRTQQLFALWVDAFAEAISRGQALGQVRPDLDAPQLALYLVSQIEGLLSMSRNARNTAVLRQGWASMNGYVQSLRPASGTALPA